MTPARLLPGFAPALIRLDLGRREDGSWALSVGATDAPSFITHADYDLYEDLSWDELLDVVGAVLDGYWSEA